MTLGMIKNILPILDADTMFDFHSDIEVINGNTGAHYRKGRNGEMLLGGEPIEASEKWVLGLPVTELKVRNNILFIEVDG